MSQEKEREALLLQTVEALRNYVDVIAKAGGGDKMLFMAAMREADDKARAALAAIGPQDFGDLTGVQPCCGDYVNCHRACTPRGRWQATKDREDALATQPPAVQGEPVAWASDDSRVVSAELVKRYPEHKHTYHIPLYLASPPSREPLTDEALGIAMTNSYYDAASFIAGVRFAEIHHGIHSREGGSK